MDCQLDLVGGKAKGHPRRVCHWQGTVELGGEGVEVWREGGRGGGRVGEEETERTPVGNFGCDGASESAVSIPEDTSGDVAEGGSDQEGLAVFSGWGARGIAPSFSRGEGFQLL